MNVVGQVDRLAQLGAGWVMWVLIAASVVSAFVMVERIALLVMTRTDLARFVAEITHELASDDRDAALRRAQGSPSFEARLVAAALAEGDSDKREARLGAASELAKLELEKNLAVLGTIGANAPFVGLLGTVIGIIRAFHELDASRGQVSTALMSEIGEALGATAVGLLVALPAVAAFNALQRVARTRLVRGAALARQLAALSAVPEGGA